MWPRSSSTGTVSVKCPLPCSRHTSVTGSSVARNSANSPMPALVDEDLLVRGVLAGRARQPALVAQRDPQARHEVAWSAGRG